MTRPSADERAALRGFAALGMFRWVPGPNRTHLVLMTRRDGETQPAREPNGRFVTACLFGPFQVEADGWTAPIPPVCALCWRFWVECRRG